MDQAKISVRVYPGNDARPVEVVLPLEESFVSDLLEPLELSDEPFSIMFKSTLGRHDYVTHRRNVLQWRGRARDKAVEILLKALDDAFAANDTLDGYPIGRGS